MIRSLKLLLFMCLLPGVTSLSAQSAAPDSSQQTADAGDRPTKQTTVSKPLTAADYERIPLEGILNYPQNRSYRSDNFLMDLTQRGRANGSAYRGMPVGFYGYNYADKQLVDPVTGYWNEQVTPYYQIHQRKQHSDQAGVTYTPPPNTSKKPVTRLIFSQDYQVGLSLVDINFSQRISKNSYIQLSGGNLEGDGSENSNYSHFKATTYRAQLFWRFSQKWQLDAFFWHLRNTYNMTPASGSTRDQIKTVGDHFWAPIKGRLSSRDSLVITPGLSAVEDRYKTGAGELRHVRYKIARTDVQYFRKFAGGHIGLKADGRITDNQADRFWQAKHTESDGGGAGFISLKRGPLHLEAAGGGYHNNRAGSALFASASLEADIMNGLTAGAAGFSKPQAAPILWRTIQDTIVPNYTSNQLIEKQGINGFIKYAVNRSLWLQLEPFALRTNRYPVYLEDENRWDVTAIENYGFRFLFIMNLWKLELSNDLTYNHKYETSFAPRLNNVSNLKIGFPVLNNALRIEGVLTARYIDKFKLIDFNRLIYQYRVTDEENTVIQFPDGQKTIGAPYNLIDARIQLYFRDATVFFIWENLISQDHLFINNTLETLQVFRLGIDWTLFD